MKDNKYISLFLTEAYSFLDVFITFDIEDYLINYCGGGENNTTYILWIANVTGPSRSSLASLATLSGF